MDDCLWDTTKELMNHYRFVFLGDSVEGLLHHVTAKSIHAKAKCVASDSIGDGDDLLRRSMLKASVEQGSCQSD